MLCLLMVGFNLGAIGQESKQEITDSTRFVLVDVSKPNMTYVIDGDTFAFVLLADIDSSMNKMVRGSACCEYSDSLDVQYNILKMRIDLLSKTITAQEKRDTAQSAAFYLLKDKYTSLETDYNKLRKSKLFGIALGGGFGANYNLDTRALTSPYIDLKLGFALRTKYITTFDVGFNLDREIMLGVGFLNVF